MSKRVTQRWLKVNLSPEEKSLPNKTNCHKVIKLSTLKFNVVVAVVQLHKVHFTTLDK